MMNLPPKPLLSVFALTAVTVLEAQVYNVNYNTASGGPNPNAAVVGADFNGLHGYNSATDGTDFNEYGAPGGLENIFDTAGGTSTIDFAFSDPFNDFNEANDWSQAGIVGRPSVFDNYMAVDDGGGPLSGNTFTLSFTGLSATDIYRLTMLSTGDTAGGHAATTFTITGIDTATSIGNASTTGFVEGQNIATLDGITGLTSFDVVITPGVRFTPINGFQLTVIPEPNTYVFLAGLLSFAWVMIIRRRK
ncbi:hypothetical protein [Rubellicoccus peritrichatus]|uniref:PEP-CTERM protein-sorting domain-containing protein n=1 Tax=Rubellicoccus peritrichatus TaxID=3080537 RepID=A0AAQ3L8G0_9BACT|nr:hypothetical protein [Puniceicoccus sp. CR14]WOO40602.1 hypothetical protein RZN69_18425 [Puniceicoccus sp. CR14]